MIPKEEALDIMRKLGINEDRLQTLRQYMDSTQLWLCALTAAEAASEVLAKMKCQRLPPTPGQPTKF